MSGALRPSTPNHPESLQSLETLVSRLGPVSGLWQVPLPRGLSRVTLYLATIGSGWPGQTERHQAEPVSGWGAAVDDSGRARLVAIAEAAERYAGLNHGRDELTTATAASLPGPVLDLGRIPRCSPRELARGCPLCLPDPTAPIRWLRAQDLTSGEEVWIPAVMSCYGLDWSLESERFWYRISTGLAVHFDPVEAIIRGICEVVERDLIAVSWLQKLSLPALDCPLPETVQYLLDWAESHFINTYLLDGTSDLGVPTVYCLQIAEDDDRVRQAVGCATGRTLPIAAEKAILEALMARKAYEREQGTALPGQFKKITDSGRYMSRPESAEAFDFLVAGAVKLADSVGKSLPDAGSECLSLLLQTFRRKGMQILVTNRTTKELSSVGLTAVSVLIPDLQPMSLLAGAQYRAHPRLYSAPKLMGYSTLDEEDLNSWPIPFA
jgi:ribosomal protein S12 methylthiotransferase accessory factor